MKFNKEQKEKLLRNKNVMAVSDSHILYSVEFKEKAILEYSLGKSARQIFIDAGFVLSDLSPNSDYPSKMISKWNNKKCMNNIIYSRKEIKDKQSSYSKINARLEYLEAENEFLKKLQVLIQQQN